MDSLIFLMETGAHSSGRKLTQSLLGCGGERVNLCRQEDRRGQRAETGWDEGDGPLAHSLWGVRSPFYPWRTALPFVL